MSIKGRIGLVQAERKWLSEMSVKYHYMHKAPTSRSIPFGWGITWDGEVTNKEGDPYGFIIYALIHYTKLAGEFGYPGLPTNWQVLSLARLWLHDDLPKNSETYVIGKTLKMIQHRWLEIHPPRFPELPYHIVKVISYADLEFHKGTIYKAANFREVKRVKRRTMKPGKRSSRASVAEMICYAYDLKEPKWQYTDMEIANESN